MNGLVEIRYRPVSGDMLEPLLDLEKACFDTRHAHRHRLTRFFDHPLTRCIAAIYQERPVGYVLLRFSRSRKSATLHALAVHPAFRMQGIGSNLLLWAEVEALQEGASVLFTAVSPNNVETIHLCHRIGYQEYMGDLHEITDDSLIPLDMGSDSITLRKMFAHDAFEVGPADARHSVEIAPALLREFLETEELMVPAE